MRFSDVHGHDRPIGLLEGAIASSRVHHAYLFVGPEGVGKERVALRLAQALNCEGEGERPCLRCGTCRRIESRNHPDVLWVVPESERVARKWISAADLEGKPSRDLRIADVRGMEHRVRLPPHEGRHKVVVLTPADRLNVPAQNALLKTLEEPPAHTTLVLVTSGEGALLPTIRSRCVRLPFGPLDRRFVAERVAEARDLPADDAWVLATLAGGSLGAALEMDPARLAVRRQLITALRAFDLAGGPKDGIAQARLLAAHASDRDDADEALGLIGLWYRDVLAVQSGADVNLVANIDLVDEAREDAERLDPQVICLRLEAVDAARRALARNVSGSLAFDGALARFGGRA